MSPGSDSRSHQPSDTVTPRTYMEPQGTPCSHSPEEDPGSDPSEQHVPEWARAGATVEVQWQTRGEWSWQRVELFEANGVDGRPPFLAFRSPVTGIVQPVARWLGRGKFPGMRPAAEGGAS